MSYKAISIMDAVIGMAHNEFLLPAIQREIVWDCNQIEKLFDSILSGYPINSMLFWKYKLPIFSEGDENKSDKEEYKFYKFLDCYDEMNPRNNHNSEFDQGGLRGTTITAVLDGQQRLTALYLGLKGYMNLKKPYYHVGKSKSYEKKFLYLNLLYDKKNNKNLDDANEYEFKFKTQNSVEQDNSTPNTTYMWFDMRNLLDCYSTSQFRDKLPSWYSDLSSEAKDRIDDIYDRLKEYFKTKEIVNYYEETTTSLDKALQIFVRINSGGTPLAYTDFLMSMIVSQWIEGKEKIYSTIDYLNEEYNFNIPQDIFLRACLYLTDSPLIFKADTFKKSTILKIKNDFDNIATYLEAACAVFKKLGYSKDNLGSNLILLPVAQYLKQNNIINLAKNDLLSIKKWIQLSVLGRVFSGQTPAYLTALRKVITGTIEFPLEKIKEASAKIGKTMSFDDEMLETLIDNAKKGSQISWAMLTLLFEDNDYTGATVYHEDHIFPHSKLEANDKQKASIGNFIANLQLLSGTINISKSDTMPDEWLKNEFGNNEEKIKAYKERHYIPIDIPLTLDNFDSYISKRKKLLLGALKKKLS